MYLKENTCGKGFSPWFEFAVCNKFTYHGSIQFVPFRSLLLVNAFNKYVHFTLTIGQYTTSLIWTTYFKFIWVFSFILPISKTHTQMWPFKLAFRRSQPVLNKFEIPTHEYLSLNFESHSVIKVSNLEHAPSSGIPHPWTPPDVHNHASWVI